MMLFEADCDRCGEPGVTPRPSTIAAAWDPDMRVVHTDPRVCRANLANN